MAANILSDDIVAGCLDNKALAQRVLYVQTYGDAMRIAIRYSSNIQDAEEILSNAYIRVFKKISLYDCKYPFMAWMRTIIIRASADYYRYGAKRSLVEIQEGHLRSKEETITAELSYQELLQKVQSLPNAYRLIFNMYEIDGYKHKEIAQQLNISVGTSKSNLFKAKKKLKELLSTQEVHERY